MIEFHIFSLRVRFSWIQGNPTIRWKFTINFEGFYFLFFKNTLINLPIHRGGLIQFWSTCNCCSSNNFALYCTKQTQLPRHSISQLAFRVPCHFFITEHNHKQDKYNIWNNTLLNKNDTLLIFIFRRGGEFSKSSSSLNCRINLPNFYVKWHLVGLWTPTINIEG